MKSHFHDQVVIVTGASSGIGKETALAFGRAGARVVIVARRGEVLRQIAAENPQLRLLPIPADITDSAAINGVIETALCEFGRIDILVNNAGIGLRATVAETKIVFVPLMSGISWLKLPPPDEIICGVPLLTVRVAKLMFVSSIVPWILVTAVLTVLPDTGERYLSSWLFQD